MAASGDPLQKKLLPVVGAWSAPGRALHPAASRVSHSFLSCTCPQVWRGRGLQRGGGPHQSLLVRRGRGWVVPGMVVLDCMCVGRVGWVFGVRSENVDTVLPGAPGVVCLGRGRVGGSLEPGAWGARPRYLRACHAACCARWPCCADEEGDLFLEDDELARARRGRGSRLQRAGSGAARVPRGAAKGRHNVVTTFNAATQVGHSAHGKRRGGAKTGKAGCCAHGLPAGACTIRASWARRQVRPCIMPATAARCARCRR